MQLDWTNEENGKDIFYYPKRFPQSERGHATW